MPPVINGSVCLENLPTEQSLKCRMEPFVPIPIHEEFHGQGGEDLLSGIFDEACTLK